MSIPVYLQNHRVFWAVKKSHEAFETRLQLIDLELAQLSLARDTLASFMDSMKEQQDLSRHMLAFCMCQHPRLGSNSLVKDLPQELIQLISDKIPI
jgi:hypothetical protein